MKYDSIAVLFTKESLMEAGKLIRKPAKEIRLGGFV
jgi:hypothetical protein